MTALARRTTVAVVLALVVALGAVGPAVAAHAAADGSAADGHDRSSDHGADDHGEEDDHGADDNGDRGTGDDRRNDRGNASDGDDGNSTVALTLEVGDESAGGEGSYVCTGTPQRHGCDKGGELSAGPASVDYEGDNFANVTGMHGGGGDEFTVSGENRTGTAGFECDLRQETLADGPCAVYGNSSEGDVPDSP